MAQVVSEAPYTLESSIQLTRPDLKTFLEPDTNIGKTDITDYNATRSFNHLHVPKSSGALNFSVTCCDNNPAIAAPMPITKRRTENRILDPLSGFVGPAGEAILNSGKTTMASLGKARIEPQTTIPQNIHSIRINNEAINELKRQKEGVADPELRWDSQKISDLVLKSRLGGWTSDAKVTTPASQINNPYRLKDIFPNMKISYLDEGQRDELAKKYLYTTSTQQMYSQVNWDSKVPQKLHAPVTTNEYAKPDPVKKIDPRGRPEVWQTVAGSTWDRVQHRSTNFHREPVSFTAPTRRGNHLPGYSGHIGGKNLQHMDDVIERFEPFTVLRNQQPKEPEPNYKPNIPGYTGHVHQFKTTSVSHYDDLGRPYTTTAAFHREMPPHLIGGDTVTLAGDFSRIQTRVPPQNAFDNIKRPVDVGINNSIDNQKHPIVIAKTTNHQTFLVKNREDEIKSILKK